MVPVVVERLSPAQAAPPVFCSRLSAQKEEAEKNSLLSDSASFPIVVFQLRGI
jgi:hypothetical protein